MWADWVWRQNRDRLLRKALDEGLPVEEVAAALQTTVSGARDLLERAARARPVEDLHLPGSF